MGHEIGEMSRFVEGQLQLSNTVKRPGAFAGKAGGGEEEGWLYGGSGEAGGGMSGEI